MLKLRLVPVMLWGLFCFLMIATNPLSACGLHSRGLVASFHNIPARLRRHLLQASNGGSCARSWLGYQCTQLVCGRIRIHWSLGGDPPSGPGCSYTLNSIQVSAPNPSAQLLHIALQTDVTGYVAASWPETMGVMAPADAVIGFKDSFGAYSIGAYSISGKSPDKVQPDDGVAVVNKVIEVNATALTICFSRNVTQVGRAAGVIITAQKSVGMNFVASTAAFNNVHLLGKDHKCSVALSLLSSSSDQDDGGWRPSNASGNTAGEESMLAERLGYMRAHGALQFTGWIVLVPMGVLAARHRWVFALSGMTGLWFQVHRGVQMLAIILVVTGFVLPWTTFDSQDSQQLMGTDHDEHMASDPLLETHETLAITLMVVLGLHIVLAVLRPKPDASWRWAWNLLHWWAGRGLAVLAGVNVAIGIALWRRVSGGTGVEWITPLGIFAVGWVSVAVWLERRAPEGRGREGAMGGAGSALTGGYVPSSTCSPKGSPAGEVPLSRLAGTLSSTNVPYNKL